MDCSGLVFPRSSLTLTVISEDKSIQWHTAWLGEIQYIEVKYTFPIPKTNSTSIWPIQASIKIKFQVKRRLKTLHSSFALQWQKARKTLRREKREKKNKSNECHRDKLALTAQQGAHVDKEENWSDLLTWAKEKWDKTNLIIFSIKRKLQAFSSHWDPPWLKSIANKRHSQAGAQGNKQQLLL